MGLALQNGLGDSDMLKTEWKTTRVSWLMVSVNSLADSANGLVDWPGFTESFWYYVGSPRQCFG